MTIVASADTAPDIEPLLVAALPGDVDYAAARLVSERSESLTVCRGELEPVVTGFDRGVMITVWHRGGLGYGATSDLSAAGLAAAADAARHWAQRTAGLGVLDDAPSVTASAATPRR